jgi:hypothetical protein
MQTSDSIRRALFKARLVIRWEVRMNVPAGAQISEDGYYYWDGDEWKLIEQDAGGWSSDTGIPEGHVAIPQDLIDDLINFDANHPHTAAIGQTGDGEAYLRSLGIDPPE